MEFRRALVRNTNGALLARCRLNLWVPGGCAAAGDVAVQCTCVQRAGTLEASSEASAKNFRSIVDSPAAGDPLMVTLQRHRRRRVPVSGPTRPRSFGIR